ncbi:zinc finger protein, partial [Oryctes borbonicus]
MGLENIKIENLNEQLEEIGNIKNCEYQLQKIETVKLEMCVQTEDAQIYRDPLVEDNEPHLKLEVNEEPILKRNPTHSTPTKDNGDILCKKCNKTFAYKYYYKFHTRTHARNTPCICDICEKVFVKPCLLKRHIVAHSEIRPYSCKICMKGFKRKNTVKQHQRIHFYRQRFPCDQCDKSFQSENKLKTHKVYHKIDDTVSHILYST